MTRRLSLEPMAALLALGWGAPWGVEGPVLAGVLRFKKLLSLGHRLTSDEHGVLVAAATAGGLVMLFNTPLAALVLAVEMLHIGLSIRRVTPVALACAASAGLRGYLPGASPLLLLDFPAATAGGNILVCFGVSCVAGLFIVAFRHCYDGLEPLVRHPAISARQRLLAAGAVLGLIGVICPRALGMGLEYLQDLASARWAVGIVLGLLAAKTVACLAALLAGIPGGMLTPLLFLGAALGAATTQVLLIEGNPGLWALAGMSALVAAGASAPLTALVMGLEISRHLELAGPLTVACIVGPAIVFLLTRTNVAPGPLPSAEAGGTRNPLTVGEAMTTSVECIPASMPLWRLFERLTRNVLPAFPVVDDSGLLVGLVAHTDLPSAESRDALGWLAAVDVMQPAPLIVAHPQEPLLFASERMVRSGAACLPVVDADRPDLLLGLLTQANVLQALARDPADREAA